MDVIVLDGNQRSALAVTRSLGRRGNKVTVGAETVPSLASSSKYCSSAFRYPSPYRDPEKFLEVIKEMVSSNQESILLPMTDITLGMVLKERSDFKENVKIPFCDYERYIAVSDKVSVLQKAMELHILIPETLFSTDYDDVERLVSDAEKFGFPLVLKPSLSRIPVGNRWIDGGVRYAADKGGLKLILNSEPFKSAPFLVQERILGDGVGIFVLMKDGNVLARFAHKRLREKPPSGGVSVLSESIEPPEVALDAATRLMREINWSGVGMVEFKWDQRDNLPKLMEVNGRFWGSLQLAISAGVDFPYLLYCLAQEDKIELASRYRVGIRSRWELGDLDHLLIRMQRKPSELFLPPMAPAKCKVFKDFVIDFFKPSVRNEVLRLEDGGPFLFELREYFRYISARWAGCCAG